MAIQPGDVWRFALAQRLFGQLVVNTFALQIDTAPVAMTESAFVDAVWTDSTGRFNLAGGLRQSIRAAQSNEVTHAGWQAQRVSIPTTQTFDRPVLTDITGAYANTAETANLSACILRRGTLGGRRQQGRIAIAGIPVVNMAAGVFTSFAPADLAAVAGNLGGGHTLANGTHFVVGYWSPVHKGVVKGQPVTYPAQFVATANTVVKNTVRVQRSRTVGVGA